MIKRVTAALTLVLLTPLVQAQDFALKVLEESPRHHEWVEISRNGRTVHAFVAYPESSAPTTSAIVIHENRGLTDWVRSFADQLAAAGYLAIAPDLLSESDSDHARTSDFASSDDARTALYQLDPAQITGDLAAIHSYVSGLKASNGKTVVMGFCWGGSQTFRYSTNSSDIAAVMVFYGSPPDPEGIPRISTTVYGFYGEDDNRINSTIPETESAMKKHGKTYDVVIYKGAGHAFMRRGDDPAGDAPNKQARDDAWTRLLDVLSAL